MRDTERLSFRHWEDGDAEALFALARDPAVGPIAGWPPHRSAGESLAVIRGVFCAPEAYAICLRETGQPIGAIQLKLRGDTDMTEREDEAELGYWLGRDYWGRALMPEAVREALRHAFEDLGMRRIWVGYFDGNERSRRVQVKCGFRFQWTTPDVDVPLLHETRVGHVSALTREEWTALRKETQ